MSVAPAARGTRLRVFDTRNRVERVSDARMRSGAHPTADIGLGALFAYERQCYRLAIGAQRLIIRAHRRSVRHGLDRLARQREDAEAAWRAARELLGWYWDRVSRLLSPAQFDPVHEATLLRAISARQFYGALASGAVTRAPS